MARPSIFSRALSDQIIELLASGKSLRDICARPGMPNRTTVHAWIANNVDGFGVLYATAKGIGCDQIADECLEIADTPLIGEETVTKADGSVETRRGDMLGHRKLQIETRLKLIAKLIPKKWGDLQRIEHSGSVDIVATLTAARRRSGLTNAEEDGEVVGLHVRPALGRSDH